MLAQCADGSFGVVPGFALRRSRRWAIAGVAGLALGVAGSACQPDTVRMAFHPRPGARYSYEVKVRSVTISRLGDAEPQRSVETAVLRADHLVLSDNGGRVRVRVQLRRPGTGTRTYVVRFSPTAQLEDVETVEGLPASVLGRLELPEVFPSAAGAPPNRPLAPGDRWRTTDHLSLPGGGTGTVQGTGHLVELGVVDGRKVASIVSRTRLPLVTESKVRGGTLSLDGVEISDVNARRALADGSVLTADSMTRGTFKMRLAPPLGNAGDAIPGTLTVEVRSQTRRVQ